MALASAPIRAHAAALDFGGASAPNFTLDATSVTIGGKQAFLDYVSPTPDQCSRFPPMSPWGFSRWSSRTPSGSSPPYSLTINPTECQGCSRHCRFQWAANNMSWRFSRMRVTFVLPSRSHLRGSGPESQTRRHLITLYGIGFGAVNPTIPAGQIVEQSNTHANSVQVSVGGVPATVAYSAHAPSYIGLYQLNIVVPNVPPK